MDEIHKLTCMLIVSAIFYFLPLLFKSVFAMILGGVQFIGFTAYLYNRNFIRMQDGNNKAAPILRMLIMLCFIGFTIVYAIVKRH